MSLERRPPPSSSLLPSLQFFRPGRSLYSMARFVPQSVVKGRAIEMDAGVGMFPGGPQTSWPSAVLPPVILRGHKQQLDLLLLSAHFEFDKTWLGWTWKERRDFLQKAIIRPVGYRPEDYEALRPYCREVSIAFLEGSLLDVLKHFLLEDVSEIPKLPSSTHRIHEGDRRDSATPRPQPDAAICQAETDATHLYCFRTSPDLLRRGGPYPECIYFEGESS
ncbi:hypothetical protein B0H17DRAFT_1104719 [Mycena rosella]|uniref:Uncharacterized protein n=1 Tax=Mycena rosella TaxID=1033263 RepID=A0AAD7C9P9_MYCRO|nr:hypothetical protein B0H17DRAFT_1104719 [Mycena rosella]